MKTFKSFLNEAGPNAKPKAKGEADFVAAHSVEITDKEDQATEGSAKVITKDGSGKRKADRLDNKQAMGEEVEQIDEIGNTPAGKEKLKSYIDKADDSVRKLARTSTVGVNSKQRDSIRAKIDKKIDKRLDGMTNALKRIVNSNEEVQPKTYRQLMREADFSKKQTTMAHTIGKEFEKKGVGDETKGGPYAVASAMVRDKPEAAKKAYATIKSKMKEETDAEILFKLYDDLNEENQEMFMQQLEEDSEALLMFAKNLMEE